jgi:hypothetical protein
MTSESSQNKKSLCSQDMYHFGMPGNVIWSMHIIFGLFFIYLGYLIQEGKPVNKFIGTALIVMGATMMLYHAHLWYYESNKTESFRANPRAEREPMPERENTQSYEQDDYSDEEDD